MSFRGLQILDIQRHGMYFRVPSELIRQAVVNEVCVNL
jgi:hypothetical protein